MSSDIVISAIGPQGVGDATDYIRLNESTGKIEFGGTMRPTVKAWARVDGAVGSDLVYKNGWYGRRYLNAATEYTIGFYDTRFAGIDTSEDIVFKASLYTSGAPTGEDFVLDFKYGTIQANGTQDTQVTLVASVATTISGVGTDPAINLQFATLDPTTANITDGAMLGYFFRRYGASASDTLDTDLLHPEDFGLWIEYRVKEIPY